METIAVYWEARVKVYGITAKPGLAMGVLRFCTERMNFWSDRIGELDNSLLRFELITCSGADTKLMEMFLVVEASGRDTLLKLMNGWLAEDRSAQFQLAGPVDMVFLHGPHFQDRFGIAETAFSALKKCNIRILLSSCAGTSMYLVFAGGDGVSAMKILTETFVIPVNP